ncbi:hypothetical protein PSCICJ_04210 [Pseudomonas cichorii]|nr:hypothetical protein PSCICJ_04210 [Pseudomonas cichorii]
MFVTQQSRQAGMGFLHAAVDRLIAEINAQWQGVDEHAKSTVGPFATLHTAQQHRAEHHFIAT